MTHETRTKQTEQIIKVVRCDGPSCDSECDIARDGAFIGSWWRLTFAATAHTYDQEYDCCSVVCLRRVAALAKDGEATG